MKSPTRLLFIFAASLVGWIPFVGAVSPLEPGSTVNEAEEPVDYSEYDRLLDTYVTDQGVKYEAWFAHRGDLKALHQFLNNLAETDVSSQSQAAQTAFYINLYNAAMLQAVLDNYPLDSVKEIGWIPFSIFKKKFIRQEQRMLSLDEVEREILLEKFFDPRIHFAINCASKSCPVLLNEAFIGKKLNAQLKAQTKAFARSEHAARVFSREGRIAYSELFKWYKEDFGVDDPAEYLNRYRATPLPLNYERDWIDYDWSLNEAR